MYSERLYYVSSVFRFKGRKVINSNFLKLIVRLMGLIWKPDAPCKILIFYFLKFQCGPFLSFNVFSKWSKELQYQTNRLKIFQYMTKLG